MVINLGELQRRSPAARAGGLCRPEPDSGFAQIYTITAFLGHGRPVSLRSYEGG